MALLEITQDQAIQTRLTVGGLTAPAATVDVYGGSAVSAVMVRGSTASISAEVPDVDLALNRSQTIGASITTQRAAVLRAPTYTAGSARTITNAATLAITGAPVAGANVTITNAYALWVEAGTTKLAAVTSDSLTTGAISASSLASSGAVSGATLTASSGVSGASLTATGLTTGRVVCTTTGGALTSTAYLTHNGLGNVGITSFYAESAAPTMLSLGTSDGASGTIGAAANAFQIGAASGKSLDFIVDGSQHARLRMVTQEEVPVHYETQLVLGGGTTTHYGQIVAVAGYAGFEARVVLETGVHYVAIGALPIGGGSYVESSTDNLFTYLTISGEVVHAGGWYGASLLLGPEAPSAPSGMLGSTLMLSLPWDDASPVSPAGTGWLRYNDTDGAFEVSCDGGAWAAIAVGDVGVPSITAGQVVYGSGTGITSSTALVWDTTNFELEITGSDAPNGYTRVLLSSQKTSGNGTYLGGAFETTAHNYDRSAVATQSRVLSWWHQCDAGGNLVGAISFQCRENSGGIYTALVVDGYLRSRFQGRAIQKKGSDLTAANDLTLGYDGNSWDVGGTTEIRHLRITDWDAGAIVLLCLEDGVTVKHRYNSGNAPPTNYAKILLNGSMDLTNSERTVLMLWYNGTAWMEIARVATTDYDQ
jgi:hypothetical protein